MKTLYVGNLPKELTTNDIKQLFSKHGLIYSVTLIIDRKTGQKRGFGFINMDDIAAQSAISNLHQKQYGNHVLTVNETNNQSWHPPPRPRYKKY